MPRARPTLPILMCACALAGCGVRARLPESAGIGPQPTLPPPRHGLLPTVDIAPAKGWDANGTPKAAGGLTVHAFAQGLDHPRWLYVLPNGDVLVAETNAPPRPRDASGIRGWFMRLIQKRAGAGVPSADRITLLRDADGDGVAETRNVFLEHLHSPFGMALIGDRFYVADTDAVLRFSYRPDALRIEGSGSRLADLPAGQINHHWAKNLLASPDGRWLYATVGSNSNAGENGLSVERDRARILQIDAATGAMRVYATGLRNPNGMGWQPQSGALWTVVNERDELGGDLVPDYLTQVREGAFYGWPWSYYGGHIDSRVKPPNPAQVARALAPDYALGSHVAALGLAFYNGALMPRFRGGAFIGEHGSWNRRPPSGYKVVFIPFVDGRPAGSPHDVLSGFLDAHGHAFGRPVGVAVDRQGALLVADDVGNTVWRVTPAR